MVAELLQPTPVEPVRRIAYTRQEAADALGVHQNTVDLWIKTKGLPHVKVGEGKSKGKGRGKGGKVLIPVHELKKWLTANLHNVD